MNKPCCLGASIPGYGHSRNCLRDAGYFDGNTVVRKPKAELGYICEKCSIQWGNWACDSQREVSLCEKCKPVAKVEVMNHIIYLVCTINFGGEWDIYAAYDDKPRAEETREYLEGSNRGYAYVFLKECNLNKGGVG